MLAHGKDCPARESVGGAARGRWCAAIDGDTGASGRRARAWAGRTIDAVSTRFVQEEPISAGNARKAAQLPVNHAITSASVRLIDADGINHGVVPRARALEAATAAGLDLVQMTADEVPVARVMDHGKHRYEQQKKSREAARAARHSAEVRQVKMRPMIDEHDYQTKMRTLRRFLAQGDRVKVTVMFRGRLVTHPELGARLLSRVRADLEHEATMTEPGPLQGRDLTVIVSPLREP